MLPKIRFGLYAGKRRRNVAYLGEFQLPPRTPTRDAPPGKSAFADLFKLISSHVPIFVMRTPVLPERRCTTKQSFRIAMPEFAA